MAGYAWVFWLGWTFAIGGGAMLVAWVVGRSTRGVKRCPSCDYDMRGASGLTCPECGRTASGERAMLRRRHRRLWLVGAIALLPLGVAALVLNPGRADGWASSLPRWAIWPLMPWFDGWTDDAATRVASAPWTPLASMGTNKWSRWDRLLIGRRCGTLADGIVELCGQPLDERIAANPPPAPPTGAAGATAAGMMNPYLMYPAADPLERARSEISGLIGIAGTEAGLAVPAIGRAMRAAMEKRDAETWWWAMRTLNQAKTLDGPTGELLLTLAKHPEISIRAAALGTLVECRSLPNDKLVGELVAAMDDADPLMRKYATAWLGKLGTDGRGGVERLKKAAHDDPDPWVRASASAAIVMIEDAK